MKSKFIAAILTLLTNFIIFVFLWNSTFSIISSNDKWFFITYIILFIIIAFIFYMSKKIIIAYILSVALCILTLTSILVYKGWNKQGFSIASDNVEYIEYCILEDNNTIRFDQSNPEQISRFIEFYNTSRCIKRWEDGARIGTPEKYIKIYLTDGTKITMEEDGCVDVGEKVFKTDSTLKELLEQLESDYQ